MKKLTALIIILLISFACGKKQGYPLAGKGDVIKIQMRELKDSRPLFMSYIHEGKRIDFFAVKTNGAVRSFFDACMKCYPKGLGYRPNEGKLVCRACNIGYPMDGLKGVGSCYPIELAGRTEGTEYLIEKEAIIKGDRYF